MAYLGNINGPRESQIVEQLGHEYFGLKPDQLASDIEHYEDSERRNEVQPVSVDEDGRPYIILSRPNLKSTRFYLDEQRVSLEGEILTFNEEETKRWRKRRH